MEAEKALKEQKEMEEVAKQLKKAMKGMGENEEMIIQLILSHSNIQRQLIKTKYQVLYKQYLSEDLKNNISGDFLEVVLALLEDTYMYESSFMNEAISLIGSDEKLITQLLCTKDAKEMKLLKSAYRRLYNRDLDSDILNNKNGDRNNLYYALASGQRQENHGYDLESVKKDAEALAAACKGKIDEKVFIKILTTISFPQLYATLAIFSEIAKEDIESIVRKHTSGNLLRTCLTMIKCVNNKSAYFAEQIHEAMSGVGTEDKTLIRLLVTRAEIDLVNIKQEYKLMYRKSLRDAVKSDTSGDYERCLLAVIGKD